VHPEERKARIRDRVDESPDEIASLWSESVVVAPEGNDSHGIGPAYLPRDRIAADPRARDQLSALDRLDARGHRYMGRVGAECHDLAAQANLRAGASEIGRQRTRHSAEVDNGGTRDVERCDAVHMRFVAADRSLVEPRHPSDSVRGPSALKLVERFQLFLFAGHDELAYPGVGDPPFIAVLDHGSRAGDAETRLRAAGRVIDP